jgi:hypothetical protein
MEKGKGGDPTSKGGVAIVNGVENRERMAARDSGDDDHCSLFGSN